MARTVHEGVAVAGNAGPNGGANASSRSRSVTETINGSHHFTINGYSLAKGMGVGKYISSQTFTVGNYQWAIYFYPDGKNAEDNSLYVSVFIALASEGTDVRALFELTLLDQSGKGKHKVHSHFDRSLESGPYTLKYRGSMWGYKRFFRRAVLETSDYLKDDSLSISCTVGVVTSSMQTLRHQTLPVPEPDIGQHFGALLDSGEGADITFDVKGETFRAHKLVLAARSPVFHAHLNGPLRDENVTVLKLEDIEPPIFKIMLYFIYRDCLPDMLVFYKEDCKTDPDSNLEADDSTVAYPSNATTMMAQHLLAAADRYGLDRLRIICEAKLCEEVSVETVATTLALAEQHHASELKEVCLKFAASNLAAVMQTEGFEHMRESCPTLQSELLKTVAGMGNGEEESKAGIKHKAVWTTLGDGADGNGRRVRQKT